MPTLLGAAIIALGGVLVTRLARREWKRVNTSMDAQRRAPKQSEGAKRLKKDPETGTYRPADD
ncbi:MAG: hypothetical protein AB8B88_00770 [Devosiaceae bacterium]